VEWALEAAAAPVEAAAPVVLGPGVEALPEASPVGVAVPTDFTTLAGRDPAAALRWRAATRRCFTHYLAAGYRVAGFRTGEGAHYVLEARS